MTALESIVEELKTLPPAKLDLVAAEVHDIVVKFKEPKKPGRFDDLCGCMSEEEADHFASAIEESCERIDPIQKSW